MVHNLKLTENRSGQGSVATMWGRHFLYCSAEWRPEPSECKARRAEKKHGCHGKLVLRWAIKARINKHPTPDSTEENNGKCATYLAKSLHSDELTTSMPRALLAARPSMRYGS